MRAICAATAVALIIAAPAAAVAGPPQAGLLVPGKSLGGLELGATKAQVERAWGRAYGRCTGGCRHETWYFNSFAFQARGAGVEFRQGRVAAIFTLYEPPGWHTKRGLALGDPVARVTALYGALTRLECSGYSALLLTRARTVTAFYVLDDRLWAFGLSRTGLALCR